MLFQGKFQPSLGELGCQPIIHPKRGLDVVSRLWQKKYWEWSNMPGDGFPILAQDGQEELSGWEK